jgi:hypothetical protein
MKVLEIKFQTAAKPWKTFSYETRQHARLNLSATAVPHFSRRTVGVAFVTRIMVWSGDHMAEKKVKILSPVVMTTILQSIN